MRTKFLALLVILMVLCFSCEGFAYKINHYREEPNIRVEASTKRVSLIPIASAQLTAARQIGSKNVTFTEIELYNRANLRTNSFDFRPVYKMECVSGGRGYLIEIDATNGSVMTFTQN